MIFLTVGTTKFPFDRLLRTVDEAMVDRGKREKLIVQKGLSGYSFKYSKTKVFKEVPFNRMALYLKKAKVVVTHGGPATIFLALKYSKNKPLVVPRSKKFGEHVDDHQQFFVKFLERKGLVKGIFPKEDMIQKIINFLGSPKNLVERRDLLPAQKLVSRLINYSESLR